MSCFKRPGLIFILFALFGVGEAYARVTQEISPYLSRIISIDDSVLYAADTSGKGQTEKEVRFKNDMNSIRFEMYPTENSDYKFFLEGFDKKWSDWYHVSFKEYTNLSPGSYTLKVRYILNGNVAGEMTAMSFTIIPPWYLARFSLSVFFLALFVASWFIYDYIKARIASRMANLEKIINKRTTDLLIEKEKTDALLANLLPRNTASELMEKGKATKMKYNFVTVLFSDIQGFTKIAEEMNPEVLIDELDKFFFYFDSVVEKYGIEKIKTIGDAYMCAGGIPEKNRTNPVEVILAALEMKAYMTSLKENSEIEGMKYWDIRIGIHTGTVVAGVVGHKKLSYDIWGDTVNTASRMESSGEAGKINISGTTYEFVREFFNCEYRGKMPVKYKGELEMYFVTGILPELCNEDGMPNRKFQIKMERIKLQDIEDLVIKMFDDSAPPNLYFNNSAMVKNICNQVDLLAGAENIPDEEYINLKLAAIFLLTGYISDYEMPMEAAMRLVEKTLPQYGFNNENTETVSGIIRKCHMGKTETHSDKILHDARYDYLGRVDYRKLTDKLFRERSEHGIILTGEEWFDYRKIQLTEHDFLTKTARLLRNVTKEDQIAGLSS
jgi:adenylate cyclase